MAAETIADCPSITRFEIVGANLAQEFVFTARSFARYTVQFEGTDGEFAGKIGLVGTDGQILAATTYGAIKANQPFTQFMGRDKTDTSIFVQADNANTFVTIWAELAEAR